ncbi:U3 snoRNP protein [Sorochytrium milnesiophthora]
MGKRGAKQAAKRQVESVAEEEALESFLFGDLHNRSAARHLGKELDLADKLVAEELAKAPVPEKTAKKAAHKAQQEDEDDGLAFVIDSVGANGVQDGQHGADESADKHKQKRQKKQKPKGPRWQDKADAELQVDLTSQNRLKKLRTTEDEQLLDGDVFEQRLRQQFEKINPTPHWASVPSARKAEQALGKRARRGNNSSSSEEDDMPAYEDELTAGLLQSTTSIVDRVREAKRLEPQRIDLARVKNANIHAYNSSVVSVCQFHPYANIMMTAGLDRAIRLFQARYFPRVDGKTNPKLQSVIIKDLPIHNAALHPSGKVVTATGRRPYYYSYDLDHGAVTRVNAPFVGAAEDAMGSLENFRQSPCGKYFAFVGGSGYIALVDSHTKRSVGELKMNGSCRSIAWREDSSQLLSVGGDGEVYSWDIGSRRCVSRWRDEGGFKNNTIAVSPNLPSGDSYIAVGSESGIVNVYSTQSITTATPKPLKSIMSLTTPTSTLTFNHDAQILAIASRDKKEQFRLVHMPSCRVFPNWPTQSTPLKYVQCADFSPHSGFLGVGNDKGRVLLYRLKSFSSY